MDNDDTNSIYLVGSNRASPMGVKPVSFSSLAVQERRDLEDWIIKNPKLLGEPLLIVTTEFHGFDKSGRRLDLLALDRLGTLVVIELKLDVARTLADQQAIRYAAFCSTMTMAQVVAEFARHSAITKEESERRVREFLDVDELPELNNRPRIILAAGLMDDTELTSCVLWLRGYGVDIRCVELTPYRLPDRSDILVVPRVIIPLPVAETFVVSVEQKEVAVARNNQTETKLRQLEFWNQFKEYAQQHHSKLRFQKAGPQHWMNVGLVSLTINSREGVFGAELYIPDDKELYERLFAQKNDIERDLGETPSWMALPEKKASRIKVMMAGDFDQKDRWESYFEWLLREAEKFQSVFQKYLKDAGG